MSGASDAESRPAEPRPGDVLGRYELIEELGRGGFGLVFRARDRVAADTVAVKVLHLERRTADQVERMRRELRAARRITHTNVVRIHDLVEAGPHLLLSMELVEGETLKARLERGPLDPATWRSLALDLAHGLAAAHDAGVTHRDLKPANILLRATTGRAVITEFGDSKMLEEPVEPSPEPDATQPTGPLVLTREGQVVGTPLYMSPEQLSGQPADWAADVYALGVVLYLAATGRPPHAARNVVELRDARTRPAPELHEQRSDLDAGVCALVNRMLAILPSARPTAEQIVEVLDVVEPPAPESPPLRPAPRRRARRVVVAAAVLIALAGGLTAWWVRREPAATQPRISTLSVQVINAGDAADDRLVPAIAAFARYRLAGDRRLHVVDDPAAPTLTIAFRRIDDQIELTASLDRAREVASVRATSVAAALDELRPAIGALSGVEPPTTPSADEANGMAAIGAISLDAYLHYRAAEDVYFTTYDFDVAALDAELDAAIALDPTWVRPYVLRAAGHNLAGDETVAAFRVAHERGDPARDPVGWQLLAANELVHAGRLEEAMAAFEPIDDLMAMDFAGAVFALLLDELDRGLAFLRRAHERRPVSDFGSKIITALAQLGRSDEIPGVVEAWVADVPFHEQALLASALLASSEGRWDDAERTVGDIELLHGTAPFRQIWRSDILIDAGRTAQAQAILERVQTEGPEPLARAKYRSGVIAVLEGRLTNAYQTLVEALEVNRPLGLRSDTSQILETLQSLAWLGQPGDLERWTEELAALHATLGAVQYAAATRYELALVRRAPGEPCPDPGEILASVPDGRRASSLRVQVVRLAAEASCGSCRDALAAGRSLREGNARSLARYATCAESEGEPELALRAWEDLAARRTGRSVSAPIDGVFESVIAMYRLGRLHAELGHPDEARRWYQKFLDRWGKVDRPMDEVTQARAAR